MLARLATALQLSSAERRYLFELAQRRDPGSPRQTAIAPPLILNTVEFVAGAAYVLDRQFTAVAWNEAASKLFVGWLDTRAADRNLLRFMFLTEASRRLVEDWPHRAARLVAEFRSHCGSFRNDASTAKLIETLKAQSAEFRRFWSEGEVAERDGGQRVFNRAGGRRLTLTQTTFSPVAAPGFLLVMLLPPAKQRS
jgi:hypothetical protein